MKRNLMSKILPIPAGLGLVLLSFAASADTEWTQELTKWSQSSGTQIQSEVSKTRAQVADRDGAIGTLFQRLFNSERAGSDPDNLFPLGRPE
jgi:hypothetical protein